MESTRASEPSWPARWRESVRALGDSKPATGCVASTGMAGGGHAEYVCLPETGALAIKSNALSWEEAVAIPFGANTALYFLPGPWVRSGRAGGSDHRSRKHRPAGVELAKHFGATVTAVCSGANVELVKSLGAWIR